jgi:hypothetical protein
VGGADYSRPAGPGRANARKGREPYYAPNPLCGGASKGALHSAKSGEEFRTIDNLVLGDCAEEGGQSADA